MVCIFLKLILKANFCGTEKLKRLILANLQFACHCAKPLLISYLDIYLIFQKDILTFFIFCIDKMAAVISAATLPIPASRLASLICGQKGWRVLHCA